MLDTETVSALVALTAERDAANARADLILSTFVRVTNALDQLIKSEPGDDWDDTEYDELVDQGGVAVELARGLIKRVISTSEPARAVVDALAQEGDGFCRIVTAARDQWWPDRVPQDNGEEILAKALADVFPDHVREGEPG